MSAETLRRAAALMREDHATNLRLTEDAFFLAVADWLDEVAEDCEYDDSPAYVRRATTAALAYLYLGESA